MKKFWLMVAIAIVLSGCDTATPVPDPAAKPNVTAAQYNVELGVGYLNANQVERAKTKLLLALQQGPHYAPAYDAMGFFLEKTGQPEKADTYYQKALTLNHNAGDSQNNYGAYLCRQKNYEAAISHFMAAVADPNYISPADAYENAGFCALAIPDKTSAKTYFIKATQQDPMHAAAYLELAKLAYDQGAYREAWVDLMSYHQATPNYGPRSLWLKAQLEKHFGQPQAAAQDLAQLRRQFPDSAEATKAKTALIS